MTIKKKVRKESAFKCRVLLLFTVKSGYEMKLTSYVGFILFAETNRIYVLNKSHFLEVQQ